MTRLHTVLLRGVIAAMAASLQAQTTGRTMQLLAPTVLGQTATFGMTYPSAGSGNPYAFLWCMPPFAGTQPLSVPGFTVQGLLRVSPANSVSAYSGVLGASGSVAHALVIPNHPSFLGMAWDLQSVDLTLSSSIVALADNDLSLAVVDSPSPSLNMVAIPPGTFQMGSAAAGGIPVHTVTISRPFWMGRDEVTQAQYQAVMGINPSWFHAPAYPDAAQRPVEHMNWYDAVAYCDALSVQEAAAGRLPAGYEYRLPTEAEWEYCCRAATTTEWNVGSGLNCSQANFSQGFYCVPPGQTSVVGTYAANAFGLRDMHGNVWEWCLDGWDTVTQYPAGPATDPYVPYVPFPNTSSPYPVLRGGGWDSNATDCRSSKRFCDFPASVGISRGFRVVCAPVLP